MKPTVMVAPGTVALDVAEPGLLDDRFRQRPDHSDHPNILRLRPQDRVVEHVTFVFVSRRENPRPDILQVLDILRRFFASFAIGVVPETPKRRPIGVCADGNEIGFGRGFRHRPADKLHLAGSHSLAPQGVVDRANDKVNADVSIVVTNEIQVVDHRQPVIGHFNDNRQTTPVWL